MGKQIRETEGGASPRCCSAGVISDKDNVAVGRYSLDAINISTTVPRNEIPEGLMILGHDHFPHHEGK
jgi:hypothetical protein